MFDLEGLEPGPFDDALLPLGPRVSREGMFEGLTHQLDGTLAQSDGVLQSSAHTAGDNVPTDLYVAHLTTAGYAELAHVQELQGGSQSIADALADNGDDVEQLRQSVQRYLPQPTAPITSFTDPPPDPGAIRAAVAPPPDVPQADTGSY